MFKLASKSKQRKFIACLLYPKAYTVGALGQPERRGQSERRIGEDVYSRSDCTVYSRICILLLLT